MKDCVCRAISTATGLNYDATEELLKMSSEAYDCEKLCVCCYHYLLEDILKYPRFEYDFEITVEEASRIYQNNRILIRVNEHLTCSIYGVILDIWDCSNELVDCVWVVK